MKFQIVTNNPQVRDTYGDTYTVEFADCSFRELLIKVDEMAQQGFEVLTHPLSGSIKPNETPYKSILVSLHPKPRVDAQSIVLMSKALETTDKFPNLHNHWNDSVLKDFQKIDSMLLASGLESAVSDHTQ